MDGKMNLMKGIGIPLAAFLVMLFVPVQSLFAGTKVQIVEQQHTITGKVVDANGEEIIGATITVLGTKVQAVSDFSGNFTNSAFYDYGCQKAHPVIRYADVLLAYAEAENELNGPAITEAGGILKQNDGYVE